MRNQDEETENIGTLVQGEIAAVETYKQALEKVAGAGGIGPELRRIEAEHEEAVSVLQQHMAEANEETPSSSGLWGEWSKAVEGVAKVLGDKAAIKVLKHGEQHGIHSYENALRNEELNADIRELISSRLLPKAKAHIPVLDRLLAQAGK